MAILIVTYQEYGARILAIFEASTVGNSRTVDWK